MKKRPAGACEFAAQIAEMGVPHLVAFERRLAPRQCETKRQEHQQAPQHGAERIGPARSVHPEPHAAPDRARQAIAPRAKDRELAEGVETDEQRRRGKTLPALELDADEKIGEIDRHQDREREQKADQQLLGPAGILGGIAIDRSVRPQMTADVGDEPEPVEAEGDELQQVAPLVTNLRNSVRLPVKSTRVDGSGGGKGSEPMGAHCISFTAATSGCGPGSIKL
ncbi:hypothetical protein ACVWZZ_002653 [Bradyrhizobium sp. LM6.10]